MARSLRQPEPEHDRLAVGGARAQVQARNRAVPLPRRGHRVPRELRPLRGDPDRLRRRGHEDRAGGWGLAGPDRWRRPVGGSRGDRNGLRSRAEDARMAGARGIRRGSDPRIALPERRAVSRPGRPRRGGRQHGLGDLARTRPHGSEPRAHSDAGALRTSSTAGSARSRAITSARASRACRFR